MKAADVGRTHYTKLGVRHQANRGLQSAVHPVNPNAGPMVRCSVSMQGLPNVSAVPTQSLGFVLRGEV